MSDAMTSNLIYTKQNICVKDYNDISHLKDICTSYDKVNLKLELDFKLKQKQDKIRISNYRNEFLYYSEEELVGYLGIFNFGGDTGEINGMVHPDWRRKGIFRRLYNLALEECNKRGFKTILLVCDDKSQSGVSFVKKVGGIYDFSEYKMHISKNDNWEESKAVTLRKALNSDAFEIGRQNNIFFNVEEPYDSFPEEDEKNNFYTYMIELKGNVIGKISISIEKETAFIYGFGILPEYRHQGYGKGALRGVLAMLSKEHITNISLEVACENKNALNLYKDCGFIVVSTMNYYRLEPVRIIANSGSR